MGRRTTIVTVALMALFVPTWSAVAQDTDVAVVDNAFEPAEITVTEGSTVTWAQTGSNPHSVTADDGSFDSHENCPPTCMGEGDSHEETFDEPGTYPYYCKIHGGPGGEGMSGTVTVTAAQASPSPGPASPTPTEPAQDPDEDEDTDEGLAETGRDLTPAVLAAMLVAVAGGALLLTRRRAET